MEKLARTPSERRLEISLALLPVLYQKSSPVVQLEICKDKLFQCERAASRSSEKVCIV
jgi:hypothetical protein